MASDDSLFMRVNSISGSSRGITFENMRSTIRLLPRIPLRDSVVPDYVRPPSLLDDSLYAFTPSEMRLYSLANKKRWTESELTEVIDLLRDPSFLRRDIGPDLQSRVMLTISYFFHNVFMDV